MERQPEALNWRYAVKKFDPQRTLEADKLEGLKRAFNLTATSYGLQPIQMVVIRHKALQEQLVAHSYGQRQVADASHVLVFCIEKAIDSAYIEAYFNRVREVRGTSDTILDPFRRELQERFRGKPAEEVRTWATHQAYLAMGNLLTFCAYERIDSCPMEGFDPAAYNRILGLGDRGLTAVLVMPVGYRAADDVFSGFKKVRRELERTVWTIEDN
ncbi:NAD(P)H-dependent oxidoreductase [Robiginitalea sp. SC105]|uniref:NAD(P)H-dependent oxidoreductase n=1 Tax=Robiginitalea sp. SC105 TaxID=2762332 RepID=UPI001639C16D|nr:NAD(P)H-dependent oxidoreductase [Robiginitalea sp. SC105]MBC2840421.1 NAD(P)H-dependent oxidoreductase [Robiginitalea sp. SC105]